MRPYHIEIRPAAKRHIKKLPKAAQVAVADKLEELRPDPRPQGVEELSSVPKGCPKLYRVRTGDYRIVYAIEDDRLLVIVVTVGDRREVYQKLLRVVGANSDAARSDAAIAAVGKWRR